jgi:membrane protein
MSDRARIGERSGSGRPGRGWSWRELPELLVQAGKDTLTDNQPRWAAAIAYYSLLSVFPLLLVVASLAAYFVEPQWAVPKLTAVLSEFMAQGEGRVAQTIREALHARGTTSILSLGALLWTGSRVFGALTDALNIAFDVKEIYGFARRLLIEVAMLLTLGLLFLLALCSSLLLDLVWRAMDVSPAERGLALRLVGATLPALFLLATCFLIYRFVPRARPDWRASLAGAGAATGLFLLARELFTHYVQKFAGYNLIYGSLSIVIVLLVWAWIAAFIVLFGGELASHVQMMVIERQPAAEVARLHEERSPVKRS